VLDLYIRRDAASRDGHVESSTRHREFGHASKASILGRLPPIVLLPSMFYRLRLSDVTTVTIAREVRSKIVTAR
jgi:hypothetical protein